ncbi:MAG: FG-GAP repeat protein, partial [Alphaproteobacteria bacterium]|nr:FG-GAP repeat protein [Alphaproteobacteria bacterium]
MATFSLNTLNGTTGFVIRGIDANDQSGTAVAAFDANGDGTTDIVVAAPFADVGAQSDAGELYVLYGGGGAFSGAATYDLSTMTAADGFIVSGTNGTGAGTQNNTDIGDRIGSSLGSLGDINGDGVADLAFGAIGTDKNAVAAVVADSGSVTVAFGGTLSANVSAGAITGGSGLGFVIEGFNPQDYVGNAVSAAGDVNGDGLADMIVGGFRANPAGKVDAGESFLLFGDAALGGTNVNLAQLTAPQGIRIRGASANETAGWSVKTAGDVNGDGFDEILIGAPGSGASNSGAAYMLFGKSAAGWAATGGVVDLASLTASDGVKISYANATGKANGQIGAAVSTAGDFNADGFQDIVVGGYGNGTGETYVIWGHGGAWSNVNLSNITASTGTRFTGPSTGSQFGYAVTNAGDFNGDGIDDIAVTAPLANVTGLTSAGEVYIFYGDATRWQTANSFTAASQVGTAF